MSIVSSPQVREVINQVVNDPAYKKVSSVPLWSAPQLSLVLLAYVGVFGSLALYYYSNLPLWVLYPIVIFCSYTAFTPLHDSTHRAVSSNNFLNDLLGTLSGFILFPMSNAIGYRYLHLAHHRYVGDKQLDPDEPLVAIPTKYFPLGYLSLLFPDFIWAHWLIAKVWKRTPVRTRINVLSMIFGNVLFHIAWFISPLGYEYLIVFFIPNRIAIAYTALTFAHTPHPEGLKWNNFPFQSTFQLTGNSFLLSTFYGQKHHAMHHFLPHIPWYKYFQVWDLANGIFSKQDIPEKRIFSKPDPYYKDRISTDGNSLNDRHIKVKVKATNEVANGIKTLIFEASNNEFSLPSFTAGAHIDIQLPSGKVRSYSLVNPPFEKDIYQIAVKLEPEGKGGSLEMHEQIIEGNVLTISYPKNKFTLYENVQKYILIGGGIGLTPLLSMAHRLTEIDKHFELHLCAKTLSEVPFLYELNNWSFAPNVEIHLDRDGKSTLEANRVLADADDEALVYVCGPAGFNSWITETAIGNGWEADQIKEELFVASKDSVSVPKAFDLTLAKSSKTLRVAADETIIDALHRQNIKVPYSCLQGTCGTCLAPVVCGEIEHRDAVLSQEEKQEGKVMCLCVSRASDKGLTIDL